MVAKVRDRLGFKLITVTLALLSPLLLKEDAISLQTSYLHLKGFSPSGKIG